MKKETYDFELRTMIAQFVDAFNDIVIRRYNNDKEIQDKIHCNFVYAPKTRTLHDIVNKAQHIKLPVISVSLAGFNRNVNRVFNKIDGPFYEPSPSEPTFSSPLQPVPIDITMNMSIVTRFQHDMDQILTNFMPYNDPYIVISWPAPYNSNLEMRNIVKWSGNINVSYPIDITHQQHYRCIADTSFVIEGWVFKKPDEPVGKIYNVDTSFTAVSDINARYEQLLSYENEFNTDEFYLEGRSQLSMANPYYAIPCVTGTEILVNGKMFNSTSGVFVSATSGVYDFPPSGTALSAIDGNYISFYYPHASNYRVSADYPGFSGVRVTDWEVLNDNTLRFTLPPAVSAGYVDVIVYNEAGYGILSKDSVRPTLNPYPSSMPQHDSYVEWNHPSISGIEVGPFYYNCT